jgi:hypothetical protein
MHLLEPSSVAASVKSTGGLIRSLIRGREFVVALVVDAVLLGPSGQDEPVLCGAAPFMSVAVRVMLVAATGVSSVADGCIFATVSSHT